MTAGQMATITPSQGATLGQPMPIAAALTHPTAASTPPKPAESWTLKIGSYHTYQEPMLNKKFTALRGFTGMVPSVPWDGFVTVQFSTRHDAELAQFMLKETYIQHDEHGPQPAKVSEPERVEVKTEVPEKPNPGDVNRKFDVDDPSAVPETQDQDTHKRERDSWTYVPSGTTPDPKARRTTHENQDPRIEALEKEQHEHGQRLNNLHEKPSATDQRVSEIGVNVENIAKLNAIREMKSHRSWHTFGEADPAAKMFLRERVTGKLSKMKNYYVLCPNTDTEKYQVAQALINDIDGRFICWSRVDKEAPTKVKDDESMPKPDEPAEEDLISETTVDWFFSDVAPATRAMDRLNGLPSTNLLSLHSHPSLHRNANGIVSPILLSCWAEDLACLSNFVLQSREPSTSRRARKLYTVVFTIVLPSVRKTLGFSSSPPSPVLRHRC